MCRSLAIGRLLLELAAPALEDDFVGLLGDPIIQQAGGEQHGDEAVDLGNAFHWRPLTRRRYWLRAPRAAISRNRRARRRRIPPAPCRSRLRPPGGSSRAPIRWPALCEAP